MAGEEVGWVAVAPGVWSRPGAGPADAPPGPRAALVPRGGPARGQRGRRALGALALVLGAVVVAGVAVWSLARPAESPPSADPGQTSADGAGESAPILGGTAGPGVSPPAGAGTSWAGGGASVPPAPGRPGPTPTGAAGSHEGAVTPTAGAAAEDASSAAGVASGREVDWWAVLGILDSQRDVALAGRDLDALALAVQPGSPAWRSDSLLVADLLAHRARPQGLATRLLAVEAAPGAAGAGPVVLQVVDQRSAYALVDDAGRPVGEVEQSARRRWEVTLVPAVGAITGSRWRISSVRELP